VVGSICERLRVWWMIDYGLSRMDRVIRLQFTTPLRSETSNSCGCCWSWQRRQPQSPLPTRCPVAGARPSRRQCLVRGRGPETRRCIWPCRCGTWLRQNNDAWSNCCSVEALIRRPGTATVSCRVRWPTVPRYITTDRDILFTSLRRLHWAWSRTWIAAGYESYH